MAYSLSMPKPPETLLESPAELAHLREQFEISLAQTRAGLGLTSEESIEDLERAEAEMEVEDARIGK